MSRLVPVLALALASCGAPVVQPLNEAKRLEPEKTAPRPDKDGKTVDAPEPTPTPVQPAEPYARTGDAAEQRDELRFWGFSPDGLRFAFETYYHGPGATKCEGEASLFVVDTTRDAFVEGTPLVLTHKSPEAERCDPPDLRAEIDRHRDELLHRHGIVTGNQGPAIVPKPAITTRGTGRASTLDLPSGKQLRAEIEVIDGDREKVNDRGGAYKLTLAAEGDAAPTVVEDGARRRPWIWDYNLDEGVAFVSPDGRHLALVLGTAKRSFEGDRHSYRAHGLTLKDGW